MFAALALVLLPAPLPVGPAFAELATFPAPEAHQAVAVDADHFYAIGNRVVAQYDRRTGERVAVVEAGPDLPLVHLNGGVVRNGRLLCSHSNFPHAPFTGSVERFALEPAAARAVDQPRGDDRVAHRRRRARRRQPADRLRPLRTAARPRLRHRRRPDRGAGPHRAGRDGGLGAAGVAASTACGRTRSAGRACGRGRRRPAGCGSPATTAAEVYRVRVPPAGSELILEAVHPAPIAGQGIAWDPSEPGVLWGTRRGEGLVVKMRLTETP